MCYMGDEQLSDHPKNSISRLEGADKMLDFLRRREYTHIKRAVELYIKYDKSTCAVIRELEYPTSR